MISAGTYLYYANSWLLAKGGYLKVLKMFLSNVFWMILILGIVVYTFNKNGVFDEE